MDSLSRQLQEEDFLIIDNVIRDLYKDELEVILENYKLLTIEANETQKSYTQLTPIIEYLIKNSFRKSNRLVAIGGGIIQDVTAFISSIMYRGVDWIFYPTTLLAQCDSCIGGKTSININEYKNQLGNFYPPQKIFIVPSLLKTLPEKDLKSGMGEMCHFYLVSGEKDFQRFKSEYQEALVNEEVLKGLIKRCLEIKKGFIEIDEFDRKERQILNYGHSFGHAIESITNYNVPHGIAVSYGMDMANFCSVKFGYISNDLRKNIRALLVNIWSNMSINDIDVCDFEKALSKDKKNISSEYRLILTRGIGKMFKVGVKPNQEFSSWLEEYFDTQLKK